MASPEHLRRILASDFRAAKASVDVGELPSIFGDELGVIQLLQNLSGTPSSIKPRAPAPMYTFARKSSAAIANCVCQTTALVLKKNIWITSLNR
ncbi:MAG: hypothetical protein ACI8PT_000421 [Gammaproteobacteria bacterium]|jgi:hypothetical protein